MLSNWFRHLGHSGWIILIIFIQVLKWIYFGRLLSLHIYLPWTFEWSSFTNTDVTLTESFCPSVLPFPCSLLPVSTVYSKGKGLQLVRRTWPVSLRTLDPSCLRSLDTALMKTIIIMINCAKCFLKSHTCWMLGKKKRKKRKKKEIQGWYLSQVYLLPCSSKPIIPKPIRVRPHSPDCEYWIWAFCIKYCFPVKLRNIW